MSWQAAPNPKPCAGHVATGYALAPERDCVSLSLSVVDMPRTLSRIVSAVIHRTGSLAELHATCDSELIGNINLTLVLAPTRVRLLTTQLHRIVGVVAIKTLSESVRF